MRPAFVFSPDLCTGCEACRIACAIENGGGRDTGWRSIYTFNEERDPAFPTRHLSLACNHCDTAACADACPANAYARDEVTGAMLIDRDRCIGCSYCSWVCPYDAPQFDSGIGVMTKCTFCEHRLKSDLAPACSAACPTSALTIGCRDTDEEPRLEGLGTTGLGPSLVITTPRRNRPPEILTSDVIEPMAKVSLAPLRETKITARSEWTLVIFTTLMPALVAWLAGGIVRPERTPHLFLFTALTAFALLLSSAHLGKPLRAWRAILNVRTSWLSREIVLVSAFAAASIASLLFDARLLRIVAVMIGVAMSYSVDAVYRAVVRDSASQTDAAETLPSLALLIGVAAGNPLIAWSAAAVKIALSAVNARDRAAQVPLRVASIVIAIAACILIFEWPFALALAISGELLGRVAFYGSLRPSTPASRMRLAQHTR